ncbi:MAG: hypothetical protein KHY37_02560 [Actinomyces graevenitzii]|nr:hypothetical protein [Actinomyces graevenitzii]
MRAGTYIKYVATCLPTALIGIGIFLAIFRTNPHLGLYSGIAALIVWGLTMAGLARALQEVGDLVKVGDDVVAKADQAKTSAPTKTKQRQGDTANPVPHKTSAPGKAKPTPGKAKAAPDEPEAALIGNWFKRRERGFPRWIPYLFDLVAAIPAAAGLVAGVAFFSGQSASLTTMAALMLTCILYVSWRQQAFKTL